MEFAPRTPGEERIGEVCSEAWWTPRYGIPPRVVRGPGGDGMEKPGGAGVGLVWVDLRVLGRAGGLLTSRDVTYLYLASPSTLLPSGTARLPGSTGLCRRQWFLGLPILRAFLVRFLAGALAGSYLIYWHFAVGE